MITQKVEYTNYNGEKKTETLYFNLSKVELAELEVSEKGGLSKKIEKIIAEKDNNEIYKTFKEIVLLAYGTKSLDGEGFIKSEELKNKFVQSAVFEEFMWSLLNDEEKASNFINSLMPKTNVLTNK